MFKGIGTGVKRLLLVIYTLILFWGFYKLSLENFGSFLDRFSISFFLIVGFSVVYWVAVAAIFWIYRGFKK
ncbi:MAG: hypothetical protein ACJAWR_002077 [Flavobacteriales bacterium]|jgi:hypothetical protein